MTTAVTPTAIAAGVSSLGDWASTALVDAALSSLGASFVEAATSISTAAVSALSATTSVDLSAAWFRRNVAVIGAVTLPVLVGLFAVQVASSVLRRDPGGLVRAVVGVVKATVGSVLAIAVTQSALIATDEVCAAIAAASGTTVSAAALQFLRLTWLSGGQAGPVLQMLFGLLVILGSLLLWAVLLFRKAALLVVAVFATAAMAGAVWDATRSWPRRWAEAVAALVLCKIAIVVVFVVGASAFGQVGPTGGVAPSVPPGTTPGAAGISDLLVGVLLLTMAVLSPWVTWRFLHWAGIEAAGVMTGAVMSSPIPGTARMAGRLAQSTGSWVAAQGAMSALARVSGRAAAGRAGGAVPPPSDGGGSGGVGGAGRRPPGPGGPASGPPQPPGGAGRGAWSPPATRVRRTP
jgi:hypothetical protein